MSYVCVMNATSLSITRTFLEAWLTAPSVALDVLQCGTVTVEPTPKLPTPPTSFTTSVGVGITGCYLPEIPPGFLRDKMVAKLKIVNSKVGVMKSGLIQNIREMRYLVLEDTEIEVVEGRLASRGFITLSKVRLNTNGLVLSNVTMQRVGAGAFNFTHQSESGARPKVDIQGCQLGRLETGAITVNGDVEVTIKGNQFRRLEKEAFKIDVRSELKFEENVAFSVDKMSLAGLRCHNLTSLERNTIHLDTLPDQPSNTSEIPFHASCGNPQVFMVVSPPQPRVMKVTSTATWVLLAIFLIVLLAIIICGVLRWRNGNHGNREYRKGNPIHFFNGLKFSKESLSIPSELDMTDVSTGVSNPLYDKTQEQHSCSE